MLVKLSLFSRFERRIIITSMLCGLIFLSNGVTATNATDLLQQGKNFYQRGDFVQAISHWKIALGETQPGSSQHLNTLIRLAAAYQKLGNYTVAHDTLQQALSFAKGSGIAARQVLVHSYLSDLLLAMQQPDAAKVQLEEHLALARTLDNQMILAHFLNNLGNILSVDQDYAQALQTYQEVAEIAERVSDTPLQIQALSNQAQAHLKLNNLADSTALLEKALSLMSQLPDSYDKAFYLLGLGQFALRIQNHPQFQIAPKVFGHKNIKRDPNSQFAANVFWAQKAYQIFTQVLQLAKQYQDKRLISYAKGFLGQLYERERRYPEAMQLTREAIFFAQEIPDILYLWKWQQARILQAQENLEGALVAYQQALGYLQPIRAELTTGQRNATEMFYERIRPVYYGFADVLLQQAAVAPSPSQKTKLLNRARAAIEQLKTAELQDYFQDECVMARQTPITTLDEHLAQQKHTAVLYPILLTDRTELLLSLSDGIYQTVIQVDYDTLGQTVLEFRRNLQRTVKGSFIHQAKQLYQWLILPLRAKLAAHNINTLVIVPDSFLRTIPMAALYDAKEKQFLFHQFALATTPGLTLTDPRRLPRENVNVLLNGLSEGVQGFPPLPSVVQEINTIDKVFPHSTVLLDKAFSLKNINHALQRIPYEIVHISSHGQFDRNHKQSFLLTYDDKLTMDRLEDLFQLSELRKGKVELLTLSACQTAVGDERAALGLAGVAIKAGARSALASLWFVDDDATSQLIADFYQQLKNPALSKAQALQNAQKNLAAQRKFRHPAYWAPFLLIGNWL